MLQPHVSKVPQFDFPNELSAQEKALETNPLLHRFASARQALAADPYRPAYHYVNPEGHLNDPNGICCWQGRYHLFYQAYPPEDNRQHWGHTVSENLVHWRDLPLAIYPGLEDKCFSGSTLVEEGRVIAHYHGVAAGNIVATSTDPLLLNWTKIAENPVIPLADADDMGHPYRVYDPCIWSEDDGYYALSGSYIDGRIFGDCRMAQHLFFSKDLARWTYLGPFIEGDIFTAAGEDGAVPYFWPIGDRHILVFASHQRGSQYLIGDYDRTQHRFHPTTHGRFNFGPIHHGGMHAPSATPDGQGGLYMIHNINHGRPPQGWDHIMSLVRRVRLGTNAALKIEPVDAVECLRNEHVRVEPMVLPANGEVILDNVSGNTLELSLAIDPREAREVCLHVLRAPDAAEYTAVSFYRRGGFPRDVGDHQQIEDAIALDVSRASLLPDVFARTPEVAPFTLGTDETLRLRIFIDRSVVEVFANERQCLALRAYPQRHDSIGVSLRAQGSDAYLHRLDAWTLGSIWK